MHIQKTSQALLRSTVDSPKLKTEQTPHGVCVCVCRVAVGSHTNLYSQAEVFKVTHPFHSRACH